ncbi:hypothetical protein A1D29_09520 [Pasteurellaceae bacterium Orientalotternb1]|nr:hypothetical protein A1D29_09520 [Pasteurellaceae bacterium Orientalotternb1]
MKKMLRILPIISLSALLAACGGGGGSGAAAPSQPKEVVPPTMPEMDIGNQSTEQNVPNKPTDPSAPSVTPSEQGKENQGGQSTAEDNALDNPTKENPPKKEEPIADGDMAKDIEIAPPLKEIWAGNFPHNKESVPVVYLIPNKNAQYDHDPEIKEKQYVRVTLKLGENDDPKNHYHFNVLDENVYYGFYRDSKNMNWVDNHYVYAFNQKAENKSDLNGLNATYKGKFIYSTRSIPEVAMHANLELTYENGAANGKISSHISGDTLFNVKTMEKVRTLELNPARNVLDNSREELVVGPNSPDRTLIDVHFIDGKDGVKNKVLVGQGGNEKYWGVIGAEKQ